MVTWRRAALAEHYRAKLSEAMALHSANAPVAATRILDREQPHVTEVMAWALDSPTQLAALAYVDIIWSCMPLLSPRLDIGQRHAVCEVSQTLQTMPPIGRHTVQACYTYFCMSVSSFP
jgi:phospholipid N-methyltransferase